MMPGPVSADRDIVYVVRPHGRTGASFVELLGEDEPASTQSLPYFTLAARDLRDMSGLSADAIGRMFPVARETVQRWISGTSEPSPPNKGRIKALRATLHDMSELVDDVREFLFGPIRGAVEGETVYDWLCQGRLSDVQRLVASLPDARHYDTYLNSEGERVVRVTGAIHQGNEPSPDYEYEDFD
jgi:hypothetical protein